jgi:hypothetical protein
MWIIHPHEPYWSWDTVVADLQWFAEEKHPHWMFFLATTKSSHKEFGSRAGSENLKSYEQWSQLSPQPPPKSDIFSAVPVTVKDPITENATRLGYEIEVGEHLSVAEELLDKTPGHINQTLASTAYLEFVIDDFKKEERDVQIEFRTKPFTRQQLGNFRQIKSAINESITNFPYNAFGEPGTIVAMQNKGWTVQPRFRKIAGGLQKKRRTRLTPKQAQHVTHSIPLAAFVKLDQENKELLMPGSGKIGTVRELIIFFYGKIQQSMNGNRIEVTTTTRNQIAPNVKTALDTIIGLLAPTNGEKVIANLNDMPAQVGCGEDFGLIQPPRTYQSLPEFPRFNPQGGRGYLSAEEKLKPPMFDSRGDVRVLIEHRSDDLVEAVKRSDLRKYLDAFRRLDAIKGGKNVFGPLVPKGTPNVVSEVKRPVVSKGTPKVVSGAKRPVGSRDNRM